VFNVVKLTPAPDDLITGRKVEDHPPSMVIDGEAEWEVKEILDSRWHQRRFQYLIKWKGYGRDVTPQANFPWKITFDTLYTNGFSIRICSRTLSISSEHNTI